MKTRTIHARGTLINLVTMTRHTVSQTLIALTIAVLANSGASAQVIQIDDFDEYTENAGIPDGWTVLVDTTIGDTFGPGVFEAEAGTYNLRTTGIVPGPGKAFLGSTWDESSHPAFSDGFLRAKIRANTFGSLASLMLRTSGDAENGLNTYLFFGSTAARGTAGGGFLFNKIVNSNHISTRFIPVDFGVDEWWNIEAGAVGNELSMKVWRDGDPEPESPQLTFRDHAFKSGQFGIWSNIHDNPFPGPEQVNANFDDISFEFPSHEDPFTLAPYDTYLWTSPMPVPQIEGPYFLPGSPQKSDLRGDVVAADDWPELHIQGQVTDPSGQPIPGLKLDFWQVDDQGNYDVSDSYDLRGHIYTDADGNYDLWTIMPANYESYRTRHMHLKLGGENAGFDSWAYTTQLYFPGPFDNDMDADGSPDKVIDSGVLTNIDAIALNEDAYTQADVEAVNAEFSDLAGNIFTILNDPLVDGYFDTTLNIVMPDVFQAPAPLRLPGDVDGDGSVAFADFLILSNSFGTEVNRYTSGDLDGDGNVAFADFLILSGNFGRTSGAAAAVPEPTSFSLVAIAAVGIAVLRRQTRHQQLRSLT